MNARDIDIEQSVAVRVMDAMQTAYFTDPDQRNPFPVGSVERRMFSVWYDTYCNSKEIGNESDRF